MKLRNTGILVQTRRAQAFLEARGAEAIAVSRRGGLVLSWRFGGIAMQARLPREHGGDADGAARSAIRRAFQAHGCAVPA